LADRADVDIDRFATLLAGALRNPLEFSVGCMQYGFGVQKALWDQAAGLFGSGFDPFASVLQFLSASREITRVFEAPRSTQERSDEIVATGVERVRRRCSLTSPTDEERSR
jgi:hypothetical protein